MNNIEGKNLILRPITKDDTANILKWRNAKHVRQNFIYQEEITPKDHERWLKDKVATGKVVQFIIIVKNTNTPIGSVYLRDINYSSKSAEYGIFIGDINALQQGFGTESVLMIVKYAFEILRLKHIQLRVLARNQIAIRTYEKAGFQLNKEKTEKAIINGISETVLFYQIDAKEL